MIRRIKAWMAGVHAWYYLGNADNVRFPWHDFFQSLIGDPESLRRVEANKGVPVLWNGIEPEEEIEVRSPRENSTSNHVNAAPWIDALIKEREAMKEREAKQPKSTFKQYDM